MTNPSKLALLVLFLAACSRDDPVASTTTDEADLADAGGEPAFDVGEATDLSVAVDAGPEDFGTSPDVGPVESQCVDDEERVRCTYGTATLSTGFSGFVPRDVHYQVPKSPPPADGYPVVLVFQGSLFSAELAFEADESDPFGAIHQTRFVKLMLDNGYAVLAPEAHLDGSTYWDTNVPPYNFAWSTAPDHQFMLEIFEAIEDGEFGELDSNTMFATGISSGGYMTSRMAVSYNGRFRALAINAGSYATCSGAICLVPDLPADHPPTLFVMGEVDNVVPLSTAESYVEKLEPITQTRLITSPDGAHEWLAISPAATLEWFETYR